MNKTVSNYLLRFARFIQYRYMKNISVIGAGTMGNGICHVFAQSGFTVSLIDVSQDQLNKAMSTISKNLDRQVAKGVLSSEDKEKTLAHISTQTSLASAIKNADLVVEAATENTELKLNIFKQIDEHAPKNCILATNTSSISITKIAAVTKQARNGDRDAFYESCACYETGRNH